MVEIGFHTDAFNSSYWSFQDCLAWEQRNGVRRIECGAIDGVSWIHGLGYQPHVALWEDPLLLRRKMEKYGVAFSQIDAAFPLSRPEGAALGVQYVLHAIRWARLAGCPCVDTTDDRRPPDGMTAREALDHMRLIYRQIIPVAEAYGITVNIEPHGWFTTKAGIHGGDALLLRLPLPWPEHGHGQYLHRRPESGGLPPALPRPHPPRPHLERQPVAGRRGPRRTHRHRRQPLRHRRRRQCVQHPAMREDACRLRL